MPARHSRSRSPGRRRPASLPGTSLNPVVRANPAAAPSAADPVRTSRPGTSAGRDIPPALSVLLLYATGAIVVTFAAWQHPGTSWAGTCCDPEQAMWYLRWAPYAFSHLSNPFVIHALNAPAGINAMWNTPILAVGLVMSPITLILGPLVAYNVAITASIAVSAWCAFLVLRRYATGIIGPIVGGAVYGFSPYVVPQASIHLDLAVAAIPPLFLLVLDELLFRRRWSARRAGVALGVLAVIQFLIAEEVVLTAAILSACMVVVVAVHRRSEIAAVSRVMGEALATATATFLVLASWPLAVQFFGPLRVHGPLQNNDTFSTDLLNLVLPTHWQLIAPASTDALSSRLTGLDFEANGYVGVVLLLVLTAFVARHWADLRVRTASIVGAVALVLSMGPHLEVGGQSTGWPLPMLVLSHVPLVGDIQPNRIAGLMWLAIAVLVTLAVDSSLTAPTRTGVAARLGALGIGVAALLPAPLPTSTVQVPAFFQNWQTSGIADGTTLLVAPYFRDGAGADAMLWAAVAGDAFRMPEAYAFVPQDSGGSPGYGPPSTALSSVMERIQDTSVTIVVRGTVRTQVAADLRAAGVSDVVVGPMNQRSQMVGFFTDLFGRPPQDVGGVQIWRDVDRQGVSFHSRSGTGTG